MVTGAMRRARRPHGTLFTLFTAVGSTANSSGVSRNGSVTIATRRVDYNLEDALFLQISSGGRLSLALRNNQLRQQLRELPLRDGGVDIRWMHNDYFEDLLAAIPRLEGVREIIRQMSPKKG